MLVSHADALRDRLDLPAAARAMGEAAVACIRAQMLSGYDAPIRRTGALLDDVAYAAADGSVTVGCSLPYASAVHDGGPHTPARPFLADGIRAGAQAIAQACASSLA